MKTTASLVLTLLAVDALTCGLAQDVMTIESDRVGIVTTTPTAPLDVNIGTSPPGSGNAVIRLERVGPLAFQLKDSNDAGFWNFSNASGGSEFRISKSGTGATELTVTSTGDVTISGDYFSATCTSPGSPCAPDYVFKEGYELMPLDELAQFVSANQHLPNVPSEDELREAKKINMSQFQMALLEKIEELTLYTLEQHRTIGEQRAIIEELQTRMSILER